MAQRKRIIALVLAGVLAIWGTVIVQVALATGPRDSTQSAYYADRLNVAPIARVISDLGGKDLEYSVPLTTGNETVVDALVPISALACSVSRPRFWITPHETQAGESTHILCVDWKAIILRGDTRTNYVLHPGDILYVSTYEPLPNPTWVTPLQKLQKALDPYWRWPNPK